MLVRACVTATSYRRFAVGTRDEERFRDSHAEARIRGDHNGDRGKADAVDNRNAEE